jgi:outer membrane protein
MKTIYALPLLLILQSTSISAQNSELDLKACVEFAIENNLQVQQSVLNIRQSELNKKQAKWAQTPSANASLRHGANFGRSIDFTSYQYVNQATHSSQFSINAGQNVYMGLQMQNRLKQTIIDIESSQKDMEQIRNTVSLNVAQAYLTVLLAEEQVSVLKEQLKVTEAQYDRTLKLITAGTIPENNKYDLEAQIARNEQSIVNAENSVTMSYINLKLLMNMDPSQNLKIKKINFNIPELGNDYDLEKVYAESSTFMPNILSARIKEQSAEIGVKIAKGALEPTISAYGSVFTNFSSAAKERSFQQSTQTFLVDFNGSQVPLSFPTTIPVEGGTTPYFKQIWNNIYSNVGVSASVPIFNGLQTRIAIERAELAVKIAKLNTVTVTNQLKSDIQRAINDVQAAEKSYIVAEKSLKATRASVDNTRKRFELGVVNGFELVSVQNTLIASESSLIQSKYDLIFKLKVLDFYRGINLITK